MHYCDPRSASQLEKSIVIADSHYTKKLKYANELQK